MGEKTNERLQIRRLDFGRRADARRLWGGSDPVELVTLDSKNAVTAASAAYDAVSTTDVTSMMAQEMMGTAATQQPSIEQFVLRDFAKEQLDKLFQFDSSTVRVAAVPEESSCYPLGKIIVTENDVAPIGASSGDSVTIEFVDCFDGAQTVNGKLVVTLQSISEQYSFYPSVVVTLAFNNLQINSAEESLSINGKYQLSLKEDGSTYTATSNIGSLTFAIVGSVSRSITIRDYSATSVYNYGSGETSITFKGTIVDSLLGGGIMVETMAPFVIGDYENYPHEGSMKITGKNNSSVTLTAMNDGATIELAVDPEGDGGAIRLASPATWDDLASWDGTSTL